MRVVCVIDIGKTNAKVAAVDLERFERSPSARRRMRC
ncbi:hypothetical protein N184_07735 [Sinorhizobium sp. GL28]|nr:hypothetical protein N184_07735 [Sinorhizobium sp. GL28]